MISLEKVVLEMKTKSVLLVKRVLGQKSQPRKDVSSRGYVSNKPREAIMIGTMS